MQNYNSMNNCCCSCGIKQAICILKDIKDLIKKQTVYFNCGTSYGEIKDSKYPNFVLIEETSETSNKMKVNLCIDDINFIKIEPKYGECQSIINELNKYYISPVVVEGKCDENCCCKSSVAAYMKDKYIKPRGEDREPADSGRMGASQRECEKLSVRSYGQRACRSYGRGPHGPERIG